MKNVKIGFYYPKHVKNNIKKEISFLDSNTFVKANGFFTKNKNYITQTIRKKDDYIIKTTTAEKRNQLNIPEEFKTVQQIRKNGEFTSVRLINDVIYNSYYFKENEKLLNNKYKDGIKGFMQKFVYKIYNNKNGCERPFIRKIVNIIK